MNHGLGDHTVARTAEHTPFVARDQLVHNLAVGPEGGERTLLVVTHQPAVTDYIGSKDSGQPTLNAFFGHEAVPSQLRLRKTLRLWVG